MRHIGGEADLRRWSRCLSVPATLNMPFSNSMSSTDGLQQMGGDLLALGDDLVGRLDDGRAADRERARAVGAHAERHRAGVAVDDLDLLDRHAELVGDDLGEGRLVALAVAVRAGEDRARCRSG